MRINNIIDKDSDEESVLEKIALARHHLKDLHKTIESLNFEMDEDIELELSEYLDGFVEDIEGFIEDINEENDPDE